MKRRLTKHLKKEILHEEFYPEGHIIRMSSGKEEGEVLFELIRAGTMGKGRDFTFSLKGLQLFPRIGRNNRSGNQDRDWYSALTPLERTHLFDAVLDRTREPSRDPDNMKIAAVGVFENPNPKAAAVNQHLIFLHRNTTSENNDLYNDNKYDNRCAERNMLDYAHAVIADYYTRHPTIQPKKHPALEIHIKGGQKEGDIVAPCGSCTDILNNEMEADASVTMHRVNSGWKKNLLIDDTSRTLSEYREKPNSDQRVWLAPIGHLARKRVLATPEDGMTPQVQEGQKRGLETLAEKLSGWYVNPPAEREVKELDRAARDGALDLKKIESFMQYELGTTLLPRLHRDFVEKPNPARVLTWLNDRVKHVRCCVIGLDDGTFTSGIDSRTGADKTFTSAESAALSAAIKPLGRGDNGIAHVYGLSINPPRIRDGCVVTLPKKGLDPFYKRRTKRKPHMLIHEFPLTDGTLPLPELEAMMKHFMFKDEELYPGMFVGITRTANPSKNDTSGEKTVIFADEVRKRGGHPTSIGTRR